MSSPAHTRRLVGALAVIAAGAPLAVSATERPTARLEYTRKAGANACPDDSVLRDAVAARLGYDPFRDDAARSIRVTVSRDAKGFHATIEEGAHSRKLDSPSSACADLASSIALSLATAIDPLGLGAAPPVSASVSVPASASASSAPAPSPSITVQPPPPVVAPSALAFVATVGGHAAFGAAPDLAFGLTTGFALRWPSFQLGVEGRVDGEARAPGPIGAVKSSILAASLVPCLRQELVFACALGTVGALRGAGSGVGAPRKDTTFYGAVGARVGVEASAFELGGSIFALRVHGDVLATLTRTTLFIQDQEAWTTPAVHAMFGLELAGIFR